MEQKSFGVYKKIAQVMGLVGTVDKDAHHGQGFQYQSAEAVTSALRGHMATVGLIMLSECVGSDDTGSQWICDYRFTFVDTDDGSHHTLSWQQATPHKGGKDDKAMGKNHTYAQKYFLLRTFMISSKDDPDADTNDFGNDKAFEPQSNTSAGHDGFTEATKTAVTRIGQNGKLYIVIEQCTFFSREPFRALGFDDATIESLGKVGVTELPEAVQIVYTMNDEYREPLRMKHMGTGGIVDVQEVMKKAG